MQPAELIAWLVAVGDPLLVLGCTLHLLLHKRQATSTLLWLGILIVLPVLGPLVYIAVGVDRLGRRATIKELANLEVRRELSALLPLQDGLKPPPEVHLLPDHLDPFANALDRLSRYPGVPGNSVSSWSGPAFFTRALQAIGAAERSVVLETYIFDDDVVGTAFLEALGAAAERGVQAHLLVDSIGSIGLDVAFVADAVRRGVQVARFDQRDWRRGRFQINLRNHRKILVIDGRVGFTGGMNVSARHGTPEGGVSASDDHHFEFRGPVVGQLMAAFAEDWFYARGRVLTDGCYFPRLERQGEATCRVVPSGPDGDAATFQRVLVAALHSARSHVLLVTPYFLPDPAVATALCVAALRGARCDVVVPRATDHPYMTWAMHSSFEELLEAGVRIHLRPPPFMHSKLLAVDGKWALVGSPNVDSRSLRLNYELAMSITGPGVDEVERLAFQERDRSEPVEPGRWERRSALKRAWANLWALGSPLL